MSIVIGLVGIGLVIFLHELGHLVAAKATGISVETFSIGWGPKITSFTRGGTEYRVSWLPLGGYCKMKGDTALLRAWRDKSERIEAEPGDFFAARPWQRIVVLAAGPFINFLFAVVVLGVIATIGYTIYTYDNRIVLASEYLSQPGPADEAGLETGDRIVAVDGSPTDTFRDIQQVISQNPREQLQLQIRRNGRSLAVSITPQLDPNSGAGQIGVYPWVPPVIESVTENSAADLAGLQPGDRIVSVDDTETPHSIAVRRAIDQGDAELSLAIDRGGRRIEVMVSPGEDESGSPVLGVRYEAMAARSPEVGPLRGMVVGAQDAVETLVLTIRSLRLLFAGVNLNEAVMGPVRLTYMAGEVASQGFQASIGRGLLSFFNFLSLISVALCFMNLLPIPALDGGQIVLATAEVVRRRPIHPKIVYRYQLVGNALILVLMVLALFNDILFFAGG